MSKTSLIIPTYVVNDTLVAMTQRCIDSIKGVDEVIVVNDGSPIPVPMATINYEQNQGYAHAVNTGLAAATGDYLIVCNNDIEFIDPHWLHELLKPLKEGAGIACIRTTEPDGWFTEDKYEENAKFGSLYAITRQTYEQLGPLDERFGKGYGEDLDYWHRARNSGIRIVKNHNGLAEHLGKATFKVTDPDDTWFNRFIYVYKQKWPDEYHIFKLGDRTIIGFNKWELHDMTESERQNYAGKEISLDYIEKTWGKQW